MTTLAILCSIGGGLCELMGLLLVASGIRDDRERAKTLFDKPVKVERPETSYPGRRAGSATPGSTAWASSMVGSSEARIVKRITDLEASVHNAIVHLKKVMDEQDFGNTEALYKAQVAGDNELFESDGRRASATASDVCQQDRRSGSRGTADAAQT